MNYLKGCTLRVDEDNEEIFRLTSQSISEYEGNYYFYC